jgi:hypothetical protein
MTGKVLKAARIVRYAAAALLLVALVLPLSRCAHDGKTGSEEAESTADRGPQTYSYYYAWTDFDAGSVPSWLLMITFLWPAPIIIYELAARPKKAALPLCIAQVLLSAGGIFEIYYHTILRELWYGGYIAYVALSAYLLASTAELVARILNSIGLKNRSNGA